jgi:hypothetical protein
MSFEKLSTALYLGYTFDSEPCREGRAVMTKETLADLEYLIEKARKIEMTPDEIVAQRRSFAYGNSAFENPTITKEMVDEEGKRIGL